MEDSISRLYTRLLGPPTKASEKRAQISGVGFGVSQGIMFLTCGPAEPLPYWHVAPLLHMCNIAALLWQHFGILMLIT